MIEFRDYQKDIINKGVDILTDKGFLYLAMEVRTGKTLTSLGIVSRINDETNNVLFLTKKKAISSIESDYELLNPSYTLHVTNYESMHKCPDVMWDVIICDEAHGLGALPKPNRRAKQVRDILKKTDA